MKKLTQEQIDVRSKLASDFELFAQQQKEIAKKNGLGVFYLLTLDFEDEKKMQKISLAHCTAAQIMQTSVRILDDEEISCVMKMTVAKVLMNEAMENA